MSIIDCKHVSKHFGEKVALEDINLEIPEGGIFGLDFVFPLPPREGEGKKTEEEAAT